MNLETDDGAEGGTFGEQINLLTVFPRLAAKVIGTNELVSRSVISKSEWRVVSHFYIEESLEDAQLTLQDLVPVIAKCDLHISDMDWAPDDVRALRTRSRNALQRGLHRLNRPSRWSQLADVTVEDIWSWPNSGVMTLRDILRIVLEIGIQVPIQTSDAGKLAADLEVFAGEGPGDHVIGEGPIERTLDPNLKLLFDWAKFIDPQAKGLLGDLLRFATIPTTPVEVRNAREALLAHEIEDETADHRSITESIDDYFSSFDERELRIVKDRILGQERATLEELGREFGITRERIRQVQETVTKKMLHLLQSNEFSRIRWTGIQIRTEFGSIAPRDDEAVTSALHRNLGDQIDVDHLSLILYIAGPYRISEKFYEIVSLDSIELEVSKHLNMWQQTPFVPIALLAANGVKTKFAHRVWREMTRFQKRGGTWHDWSGSVVDKAELILHSSNRPMTVDEIVGVIGEEFSIRSVTSRLFEDHRFMRVRPKVFALRKWDLEEYSGITQEIAERIERDGGSTDLKQLVEELVDTFGVSELSVLAYSKSPMFIIGGASIYLRQENEMIRYRPSVRNARGWFLLGDRVVHLTEVDADLLRGSGKPISPGVAASLGIQPSEETTYHSKNSSVRVTWPISNHQGGSLGSMRDLSLSVGAQLGDLLRVSFYPPNKRIEVSNIARDQIVGKSPIDGVNCLIGSEFEDLDELLTQFSRMLRCDVGEVIRTLERRKDPEILDVLRTEISKPRLSRGWTIS